MPAPRADSPPMIGGNDEALMGALAAGDTAALNLLMDRWQVPLRSFLYRYTQNEPDALDLAQETFVRVYQHRARYRTGAHFSTWVFQIALNLARSRARWQRRHPTDPLENESEDAGAKMQVSTEVTPAEAALTVERAAAVRAAVAALPAELREAVVLFEYQDKTHAEIAEIVRATPKAVETRLYRARQQLRKTLARYFV